MEIRAGLKFSKEHEWIREQDSKFILGITDFAQAELGDIVFIELPKVGTSLKAGDVIAVIESTKAASDIYSPFSGTVVEVNENLSTSPELVNREPYDGGWIAVIQPEQGEANLLMSDEEYAQYLKQS